MTDYFDLFEHFFYCSKFYGFQNYCDIELGYKIKQKKVPQKHKENPFVL